MNLGRYGKLITAIIGLALALSVQVWGTSNHWVALAISLATVLGIYVVPNQTGGKP